MRAHAHGEQCSKMGAYAHRVGVFLHFLPHLTLGVVYYVLDVKVTRVRDVCDGPSPSRTRSEIYCPVMGWWGGGELCTMVSA